MKKFFILLISLTLITGCSQKNNIAETAKNARQQRNNTVAEGVLKFNNGHVIYQKVYFNESKWKSETSYDKGVTYSNAGKIFDGQNVYKYKQDIAAPIFLKANFNVTNQELFQKTQTDNPLFLNYNWMFYVKNEKPEDSRNINGYNCKMINIQKPKFSACISEEYGIAVYVKPEFYDKLDEIIILSINKTNLQDSSFTLPNNIKIERELKKPDSKIPWNS